MKKEIKNLIINKKQMKGGSLKDVATYQFINPLQKFAKKKFDKAKEIKLKAKKSIKDIGKRKYSSKEKLDPKLTKLHTYTKDTEDNYKDQIEKLKEKTGSKIGKSLEDQEIKTRIDNNLQKNLDGLFGKKIDKKALLKYYKLKLGDKFIEEKIEEKIEKLLDDSISNKTKFAIYNNNLSKFMEKEFCYLMKNHLYEKYQPNIDNSDNSDKYNGSIIYKDNKDNNFEKFYIVVGYHKFEIEKKNNGKWDILTDGYPINDFDYLNLIPENINNNSGISTYKNFLEDSSQKYNIFLPDVNENDCENIQDIYNTNIYSNLHENTIEELERINEQINKNYDGILDLYTVLFTYDKDDIDVKFYINMLKNYVDKQIIDGKDIKQIRRDIFRKVSKEKNHLQQKKYNKLLKDLNYLMK